MIGNSAVANAGVPVVTTIAGNGEYGIDDGQGSHASFLSPAGVAFDRVGNIFVSDEAPERIRRISPAGEVKTVAGTGAIGELGFSVKGGYRDGPALSARFNHPVGVVLGRAPLDAAVRIATPHVPGAYTLAVTLLKEGVAWFDDLEQTNGARGTVVVAAR